MSDDGEERDDRSKEMSGWLEPVPKLVWRKAGREQHLVSTTETVLDDEPFEFAGLTEKKGER